MFYRYEHYMSISHMALIVAMEQSFGRDLVKSLDLEVTEDFTPLITKCTP